MPFDQVDGQLRVVRLHQDDAGARPQRQHDEEHDAADVGERELQQAHVVAASSRTAAPW